MADGVLTVDDILQAAPETRRLMQQARDDFGRGLYLVDARQTVVQPRDVMEEVERQGSYLSHPEDRMAIVVPSTLASLQSRRAFHAANERVFQSMEEAVAWLTER